MTYVVVHNACLFFCATGAGVMVVWHMYGPATVAALYAIHFAILLAKDPK